LICDFDGTLTQVDVGDALCDRFADARWRAIDEQWLRGELSLPEAQRRMWGLVRATPAELVAHAEEVGELREGAAALLDAAARGALDLVIASGGFDLYIHALLGARRSAARAIYANHLAPGPGRTVRPVFLVGFGCETCAVCKAEIVRRHASADAGRPVAFCGDGSSDRCAAAVADRVFAVTGGHLARHCERGGIPYVPFDDLGVVIDALLG
jgi:2,3-diketo-5-methylthio-1-phosphopentane phosphatase